jgi:hypothetical protein
MAEFASRPEALAVAFANLKGAANKDLLRTAEALNYLMETDGSQAAVADAVGVSREIVREFLSLLRLPSSVQKMISSGEINSLEKARRLAQLARHRPREVEAAAKVMAGISAHDSRALAEYLIAHRDVTPTEAERVLSESKGVVHREFHVVAVLDESEYRRLVALAEGRSVSVDDLVSAAVRDLLTQSRPRR